ncbi:MAG: PhoU domain-containing protein [bacterium]
MLRELLSLFRATAPLEELGRNFTEMLEISHELTVAAGEIYFRNERAPEERTEIYRRDVKVNKLERRIRKQVIKHLSLGGNTTDLPYCLLLMSLVKDVERIGDYAKNLTEAHDFRIQPLADDAIVAELREIRSSVEAAFSATADAFAKADRESALTLIEQGRSTGQRCDALLVCIAHSDYDAGSATAVALGTRYYKRISAHATNVLTSVVMPLHKLDYYDEDIAARGAPD